MEEHVHIKHFETTCPACNHKLNSSAGPHGTSPQPGDITVCFHCSTALEFLADKTLAIIDEDDPSWWPYRKAINLVRSAITERKKRYEENA